MTNKALPRFGFVFFVFIFVYITENRLLAQSSTTDWGNWGNWGFRFGLNATSVTKYSAYQGNEILTNSSYTNKTGSLLIGFARFNINRVFLQPEVAWNEYHRTCSFAFPIENSNSYFPSINLNINSKAVNTNFLVGYNIVYNYPFLFGFYFGSSFIGTYGTNYSMGTGKTFTKTGLLLNYSGILGFSINISRIYFDLRYEMSLPNADLAIKDIPDFPEDYQNVKIKKMEDILSLSFGVMF